LGFVEPPHLYKSQDFVLPWQKAIHQIPLVGRSQLPHQFANA
jgi:hypothetical protein